MTLDEIKRALKKSDKGFDANSAEGKAQIVLLSALEVGPYVKPIAKFTGIPLRDVSTFCSRLRSSGVFKRGRIYCDWFDKEHGGVAFAADTAVALGWVRRG